MKVAICLSGHLRNFEKTFPRIKSQILDTFLNPDIFISVWDKSNTNNNVSFKNQEDDLFINIIDQELIDMVKKELNSQYNYTTVEVENLNKVNHKLTDYVNDNVSTYDSVRYDNLLKVISTYYKIWKCNILRNDYELKNKINYDLVIRCDTDTIVKYFNFDVNLKDKNSQVQVNTDNDQSISDLLFSASPQVMNRICGIYLLIGDIYRNTNCLSSSNQSDMLEKSIQYLGIQSHFANSLIYKHQSEMLPFYVSIRSKLPKLDSSILFDKFKISSNKSIRVFSRETSPLEITSKKDKIHNDNNTNNNTNNSNNNNK
jgi:hypothetical protein